MRLIWLAFVTKKPLAYSLAIFYTRAMLKLPERSIKTSTPLSDEDKILLQAHLEALIITMDRLAISNVELEAKNVGKNGAQVTMVPMK